MLNTIYTIEELFIYWPGYKSNVSRTIHELFRIYFRIIWTTWLIDALQLLLTRFNRKFRTYKNDFNALLIPARHGVVRATRF